MSARKMASILGSVRAYLPAFPFLRAFTDQMVTFVNQHHHHSWDKKHSVPLVLKEQVLEVKDLMIQWTGRPFFTKENRLVLHSDSSHFQWAGINLATQEIIQDWWRDKVSLHINHKELLAAMSTVKSFAPPKSKITLCVDNIVTFSYLSKSGGRLPHLNCLVRPFLHWCQEKKIDLELQLVKSQDCLADQPSRMLQDRGDYSLDPQLFHYLLEVQKDFIQPQVDMFATPSNKKLHLFVAKYPHWDSFLVDALKCPLSTVTECYANPPWSIIGQWLHRLKKNPHLHCLLICPYWVSMSWWPLLTKLVHPLAPQILIPPYQGMFSNCYGMSMPPPHWPLLCVVLSGAYYRGNKFKMKPLWLTWEA